MGDVDDERIAFPATNRVPHIQVVGRPVDLVQVDRARRVENANAISILFVLWTIWKGYGMYIARGIPGR